MKILYKEEYVKKVAENFLEIILNSKKENKATVICLTGNLGAGKTTLMQAVGKLLGIEGNIISPTFVIRRDYILGKSAFKNLIHIDAYRLDKQEMLDQILTKQEIADKNNLIIMEWGERLDKDIFDLTFEIKHISEVEREIVLM
jgi:tRNA threonylcarbamoyladenosine biosynthesis protein TsaE